MRKSITYNCINRLSRIRFERIGCFVSQCVRDVLKAGMGEGFVVIVHF
ncbi:hypothetical protein [Burkholderia cepacia]|nr:hypothetical protein [Burkholderia cepacia]